MLRLAHRRLLPLVTVLCPSSQTLAARWLASNPEAPPRARVPSPAANDDSGAEQGQPRQRPDDFADRGATVATSYQYNLVQEDHSLVRIDGCSAEGFVINNVHVPGAVLAYKNVWFMWRVASPQDVTPNSLAFLRLLRPVPDLLVLGTGARAERPSRETLTMLKSLGIAIETLTTARAVEYFNLLNQEDRSIVAALLPAED